jgi:hypothetical protein
LLHTIFVFRIYILALCRKSHTKKTVPTKPHLVVLKYYLSKYFRLGKISLNCARKCGIVSCARLIVLCTFIWSFTHLKSRERFGRLVHRIIHLTLKTMPCVHEIQEWLISVSWLILVIFSINMFSDSILLIQAYFIW